ncbi:MAG: hypothetical protein K2X80_01600 [Pseudomonadaceae bacterium]|nr:hypothetical protein [Pseudomonadaceae bacterium]
MTSPTANADTQPDVATQPSDATAPAAKIPAFRFPFSPATFAPNKDAEQPWHQQGNKSSHDKTPSRAPNGTRRSMGKR